MCKPVEDALLEELLGHASDHGLFAIEIHVTKTARNVQILETLRRVGFAEQPMDGDTNSIWALDLKATNRKGQDFARWFKHDAYIQQDIG